MHILIKFLLAATTLCAISVTADMIGGTIVGVPAEAKLRQGLSSVATRGSSEMFADYHLDLRGSELWKSNIRSFKVDASEFAAISRSESNLFSRELMIGNDIGGLDNFASDFSFDRNYPYSAPSTSDALTLMYQEAMANNYGTDDYGLGSIRKIQNDNILYVSAISDEVILDGAFTFDGNSANEGWGLSGGKVGILPEPGTLLLMALGMLCLGLARRRAAKQA